MLVTCYGNGSIQTAEEAFRWFSHDFLWPKHTQSSFEMMEYDAFCKKKNSKSFDSYSRDLSSINNHGVYRFSNRQLRFLEGSGREFHHQTRTLGNSMLYHHVPYWNAREYTTLHPPKYHSVGRIYLITSPYYACFYPIISHCIIHLFPSNLTLKPLNSNKNHENLPKTGRWAAVRNLFPGRKDQLQIAKHVLHHRSQISHRGPLRPWRPRKLEADWELRFFFRLFHEIRTIIYTHKEI